MITRLASSLRAKEEAEARVKSLSAELETHQRINKALRVGRAPSILIDTLNVIKDAGLDEHFLVIGTHALYAYETAASAHVPNDVLATQDIDLLFDTRKRVKFFSTLKSLDSSFLAVLQRADKTFRMRDDQLYTAVNNKGFEVDVVRRAWLASMTLTLCASAITRTIFGLCRSKPATSCWARDLSLKQSYRPPGPWPA